MRAWALPFWWNMEPYIVIEKADFCSILYSIIEIKIEFWLFDFYYFLDVLSSLSCIEFYIKKIWKRAKWNERRTFLKTNWKHWLFQIQFTNTKILNFTEKSFLVLLYLIVLATSYFWEQSLLRIRDCSYWKFYFIDCGDL